MINFKTFLKFLLWILIPYASCSSGQPTISLVKVPNLSYSDTNIEKGNKIYIYCDSYIVSGYRDEIRIEKQIDNSIFKINKLRIQKFDKYYVVIYKYSNDSNLKSMKKHGDRYSQNDIVYLYNWSDKGKYFHKFKFKDGEIINDENKIIIQDLSDSLK